MKSIKKPNMSLAQMAKRLVTKKTKKYGMGVFALENFKKGEVVYILGGTKMTLGEFIKKVNSSKENIDDPFQVGRKSYIDLNEISRTFNHSCDPSTGIRKISEMFALRDIKKGGELTYDYSLTIAPTKWRMSCKCGSKKCRGVLGDIRSVPKRRLREYRDEGALQNYMKSLLSEIESGTYEIPAYELEALKKLCKTHN